MHYRVRSPTSWCRRWPLRGLGGVRDMGSGGGSIGGSHPLWSLSLEKIRKRRPAADPLVLRLGIINLDLAHRQWRLYSSIVLLR
ncbi:hypothetical protein BS78_K205600 [Paspalum vaginatum]|uniref:Uncharacterized protein n=1 Tax=Paspalum vaginatum TaxID=158149 RepID=A0A9W7XBT9_9POAL|nr:hypothetical protein BS78_K205600 [Paspalum vaginatum]